jgi:hypothetical protein
MSCLRLSLPILFVVLGFVAGCSSGPKRSPVSGTVKYKGQPIKAGTINFRSEDGKHVGTGTITDGKYDIPLISGLPAGKYSVAISYPDPKVPAPKGDEAPGEAPPVREMLPAKYANGSDLKADIKDGPNTDVNFDLK